MLCGTRRSLSGRYHGWHMDALWDPTEFAGTLCSVGPDGVCGNVIMVGTWMLCGNGRSLSERHHGWHMDALWERTDSLWTSAGWSKQLKTPKKQNFRKAQMMSENPKTRKPQTLANTESKSHEVKESIGANTRHGPTTCPMLSTSTFNAPLCSSREAVQSAKTLGVGAQMR